MQIRRLLRYAALGVLGLTAAMVVKVLVFDFRVVELAKCPLARALGETEPLPPVTVIVSIGAAARHWLSQTGEGISGSIWFDGYGDPGHKCKTDPNRPVFLGRNEFAMPGPGKIVLDSLDISIRQRAKLEEPDFYYTMNIYSARLVDPNNRLSCGLQTGRIDALLAGDRTITVQCRMF